MDRLAQVGISVNTADPPAGPGRITDGAQGDDRQGAVIAVEEHLLHISLARYPDGAAIPPVHISDSHHDLREARIAGMDAAGVDMQVLSHQSPGSQCLPDDVAVAACPGDPPSHFAEVFRRNFWITTSGFFSDAALRCCLDQVAHDRILFAVDYPYASSKDGVDWLSGMDLDPALKARIFSGNARGLLGL